jgi:Aldo/keto reductase family
MKSLDIAERHGWPRYVAHQIYYSLVGRDYEWELMPLALNQGVGAMVWSPLGWARLTGKIRRGRPLPEGSRLRETAQWGGCDFAGFQHTEIKPGSVMLHQQGGHTRLVHSDSNPVARHSGLRHFEQCAANPITVTNAHLIVRQSLHREVLAELSKHEVLSP